MQIFSRLHSGSSQCTKSSNGSLGFTLIELIISIAIIVLLSSVVIVRFSVFDSSVLLKSAAYEIATTIREAQVYAVSVLGADPNFDYPFGVTFTENDDHYTLFKYNNTTNRPKYDPVNFPALTTDQYTRYFDRNTIIADLCVFRSDTSAEVCNIPQLDISFRRPEFTAIFTAKSAGFSDNVISNAKIILQSKSGGDRWYVEVGLLGYIQVVKE